MYHSTYFGFEEEKLKKKKDTPMKRKIISASIVKYDEKKKLKAKIIHPPLSFISQKKITIRSIFIYLAWLIFPIKTVLVRSINSMSNLPKT